MSNTTKQRLSVGAVLIGLLGFGVLCFTWSTMPPPEASANPAATAGLTVAQALPVAATADPMATAALEGLGRDYRALAGMPQTVGNIDRFQAIVDRAQALSASGQLTVAQYTGARELIADALERQGKYPEMLQAYRTYLDGKAVERGDAHARQVCRRRADRRFANRRYHDAMEFYAILAERWPDAKDAGYGLYRIGVCYEKLGDPQQALGSLKLGISSYQTGAWIRDAYMRATNLARLNGNHGEAAGLYRDCVRRLPASRSAVLCQKLLVRMYAADLKDPANALAECERLRAMLPATRRHEVDNMIRAISAKAATEAKP